MFPLRQRRPTNTVLHVGDGSQRTPAALGALESTEKDIDIESVPSGADALDSLGRADVACIVSEATLPDGDGLALLDAVRELSPELPFVLLDETADEERATTAIANGATDYIEWTPESDHAQRAARRIENAVARYRAERDRERSGAYFDALIQQAPDAILTIDGTSTIVFANEAVERIFGYAPDELVGESLTALIPDRMRRDHLDAVERYRRTGNRQLDWEYIELPGLHRDGHEVSLAISFREVEVNGQQLFSGIIRDITDRKEREQELTRYETIANTVADGIYRLDADGRFVAVNDRVVDMTGYSREQLLGEHVSLVVDEETIDRYETEIRELLTAADEAVGTLEIEVETAEGEMIPCQVRMAILRSDDGSIQGTVGVAREIAEQRKRERELEETTRKYRKLIDTAPDAIFTVNGETGIIIDVNDAAEALLGKSRDELIGMHQMKLHPEDEADRYREIFEEHVQQGGIVQEDEPLYVVHDDGHEIPVEINAGITQIGDRTVNQAVFRDVSERKRAEEALKREQKFTESALDTLPDIFFAFDLEGEFLRWNGKLNEVTGYSDDEIAARRPLEFFSGADAERAAEAIQTVRNEGRVMAEVFLETKDGRHIPYEFTAALLEDENGDPMAIAGIGRDITERKEYEETLDALREVTRDLMVAGSKEEICEITVETAQNVLDLPITGIHLLDEETNVLRPAASSTRAQQLFDELPSFGEGDGLAWRVFTDGAAKVYNDVHVETDAHNSETPIRSEMILPLGEFGVFMSGSTSSQDFTEYELDLAKILAANTQTALDRADREQEMERQRDQLDELNRINRVIRDIDQALVDASTREEIEQGVCDRLAASAPYTFAWIGASTAASQQITPRAWAGGDEELPDGSVISVEESETGRGPSETAMQTRQAQVVQDLGEDASEPWYEHVRAQGCRSAAVIPLVYGKVTYGLLYVCADHPDAFDEEEITVLGELGRTIGGALNAVESKKLLLADTVIELEFRSTDSDIFLIDASEQLDCTFTLDRAVPAANGKLLYYVTAAQASPEAVLDIAADSPAIENARLVADDYGDESHFEFTVSGSSAVLTLTEHGAKVTDAVAERGEARITVEVASNAEIRSIVEAIQTSYSGSELVARREVERPVQTQQEFREALQDQLTDQQRATLQAAYFAGFFEWPRESTGEEIAESMSISAPTFHQHLRLGQHKLFAEFFDGNAEESELLNG